MDALDRSEAALIARDEPPNPWHLTEVTLLSGSGLSLDEVAARVAERLSYVPRFRQCPEGGHWIDDVAFRLEEHLRVLPVAKPTKMSDLQTAVMEGLHEPLPRTGARWVVSVAETVTHHRSALLTRVQPAWVDGADTVHLLQELLDDAPVSEPPVVMEWEPQPPPEVAGDFVRAVRDPGKALANGLFALARLANQATAAVVDAVAPPVRVPRFVAGTGVPMETLQRVARGAHVRVHDVLVAMVAGGLHRVGERRDPLACTPLAVDVESDPISALGFVVQPAALALPVCVEDPMARLDHIATYTQTLVESRQLVSVERMTELPGFAAATVHALGARAALEVPGHEVVITNVPGPVMPRFLGEREVRASYPFLSLQGNQRLSVAMTSYCGQVAIGLTGRIPLDNLVSAMIDELHELGKVVQD